MTDKAGPHVEAVGSGVGAKGFYVYECSEGDFVSRTDPEAVEEHIATAHGGSKPAKAAKTEAPVAAGSFKALQAEAAELGIKAVGVKRVDLEAAVAAARAGQD